MTGWIQDETEWPWIICIPLGLISGGTMGALELMVFVAIYEDSSSRDENNRGAGDGQKAMQTSEGVLEALPEVIMQSVFYMR